MIQLVNSKRDIDQRTCYDVDWHISAVISVVVDRLHLLSVFGTFAEGRLEYVLHTTAS